MLGIERIAVYVLMVANIIKVWTGKFTMFEFMAIVILCAIWTATIDMRQQKEIKP